MDNDREKFYIVFGFSIILSFAIVNGMDFWLECQWVFGRGGSLVRNLVNRIGC